MMYLISSEILLKIRPPNPLALSGRPFVFVDIEEVTGSSPVRSISHDSVLWHGVVFFRHRLMLGVLVFSRRDLERQAELATDFVEDGHVAQGIRSRDGGGDAIERCGGEGVGFHAVE